MNKKWTPLAGFAGFVCGVSFMLAPDGKTWIPLLIALLLVGVCRWQEGR